MELENTFSLPVLIERAWELLTDVSAVARCLAGVELNEVDGDEYRGTVELEVGSTVVEYEGVATFVETDQDTRRIVLRAEGDQTEGQGNATATITAVLSEADDATLVTVHTDMAVTGSAAQFSRATMEGVATELLKQFSERLTSTVLGEGSEGAPVVSAASGSAPAEDQPNAALPKTGAETSGPTGGAEPHVPGTPGEPEPIDLLGVAGGPTAKRVLPAVLVAAGTLLAVRYLLRRRGS